MTRRPFRRGHYKFSPYSIFFRPCEILRFGRRVQRKVIMIPSPGFRERCISVSEKILPAESFPQGCTTCTRPRKIKMAHTPTNRTSTDHTWQTEGGSRHPGYGTTNWQPPTTPLAITRWWSMCVGSSHGIRIICLVSRCNAQFFSVLHSF